MIGQTLNRYKENQAVIDKYVAEYDIYNSKSPIPPMDLRGYADYVREHGLESATEETVKMFIISPSE